MPPKLAVEASASASPPSRSSTRFGGSAGLLLLSIAFHLVYLGSIFDIYFKSPVTKGVGERYGVDALSSGTRAASEVQKEGLAKRVVLIVGDGLRADKLFQTYPSPPFAFSDPLPSPLAGQPHALASASQDGGEQDQTTTPAPFIRGLIQSGKAEWGVSHTRVPTESRPGHVALIGGMYEDVSAVTRGWTTNPVAFDSVFNQSSHTYSFGSPDILPMFQQGASDPHRVDAWSYGEEYEDFSADAVHLDLWCLEQLKVLLDNSTRDAELKKQLNGEGTVFFLHLLGLDTTGHSYRPHGAEYHRNIRVVDHVVEETVRLMDEFYGDEETAYVFTADHGMSSKGNHGDGAPENTRTPLVVWGKGVGGKRDEAEKGHDEYSEGWGLEGVRRDVEQADVAVLMSILGGLNIPANSAGRVPLDYLDGSPSFKARAALANANQILAEFTVKSDFKRDHALSFSPFPELVNSHAAGTHSVASRKAAIKAMIDAELYEEAQNMSMELVKIGLRGLRYFQTYDWLILRTIVTLGYLGFILYNTSFLLRRHVYPSAPLRRQSTPNVIAPLLGVFAFTLLSTKFMIEQAPPSYYLYALFPAFFFSSILSDPWPFLQLGRDLKAYASVVKVVGGLAIVLSALQTMVWGYSLREVFAVLLVGMGIVWPTVGMESGFLRREKMLIGAWGTSCAVLAVFPLLPVEKGESIAVIMAGGASFLALAWYALRLLGKNDFPAPGQTGLSTLAKARLAILAEIILTIACMVVTASSARSLQLKQGLPLVNQVSGWLILVLSLAVAVIHGRPRAQPFFERLLVLLFAFAPAFIILSLSYEALFFATLCTTLIIWMMLELKLVEGKSAGEGTTQLNAEHARIALFFLAFLHVCFFGVGNVASISSFYLEPVYRLIPVFAPFPMAALLLFKLLTPFVALSAVTSVLNHRLHLPLFSLFIIASTLSDYLALNFFFLVTDEGSWLEIGSTITNYAICSLLGIFNTVLYLGGEAVLAYCQV
ncbi:Phosphatidylinositolglycan class N-domain-containing protein [Leucosporidium creatinivorum]|uniref:GPI ethanolamine phosphate transferase 1 n=1 Tax=Leucosporidium creatinivorum TaxID=106004 RepID=A0A1Y2EMF7_9BASI|nr:Phosphatidylinositolglycan class N-domain-containing protein [Leucosporidium creatinivorum]